MTFSNHTVSNQRLLVSAAVLVAVSSLLSRVLGLVRDRLFASMFGAGPTLDAYFAAYRIPDLLFNLLILGTLSAAFLPVFTSARAKGDAKGSREAFQIAQGVMTITILLLSLCALLLAIAAPILVPIIAPGFDPERTQLTIDLTRIMLLQPILLGASSILGGMLNSFGRFFAYAAAPVLYNLGIIAGLFFFVPTVGIAGAAWGVVLGAALHFLIQLPNAWKLGFRPIPRLFVEHGRLWEIGRLMVPRLIGLMAGQVGSLIVTIIGSLLAVGSIAVYAFAENLQTVPVGLVGISFAIAAFPQLSESAATNAVQRFIAVFIRSLRFILFLIVPLSVMMLLLRAQIVRVVLGTGAFDWEDTVLTLNTLGILVMSVFAQSLTPLLSRAFFALKDTRTPMVASVVSIGINVIGAWFLAQSMGVEGLALAFSLAAVVNAVILLVAIHHRLGGLNDREVLPAVLKIAGAAVLAGCATQLLKFPIAALVDMQRTWGITVQLIGAAVGGLVVYTLISWWFGSEELRILFAQLRRAPRAEASRASGAIDNS